ncbi:MAG: hypothetical protein HF978_04675 [Desulfobacteraceae bacterium]|nr:hypothetical protein [Desulfobacteraceae bacterium]MBC2754824.1 hypothetical protein [Desulfobacteraceae bacterium]
MTSLIRKTNLDLKYYKFQYRLLKLFTHLFPANKKVYVANRVTQYKEMWKKAASQLAAQLYEISEDFWEIRYEGRRTWINNYKVQLDDPVILSLAGDKAVCYALMQQHGIKVNDHCVFCLNSIPRAEGFINEHDGLFVIKPAVDTSAGLGVTTHIKTSREGRKAAVLASIYGNKIIIERFIPGELYRLLFLNGKMIHATRRRGIWLESDGRRTVIQLFQNEIQKNTRLKYIASADKLRTNQDAIYTLKAQGLTCDSITETGRKVLVLGNPDGKGNLSEEVPNYSENVTQLICPDIRKAAGKAAGVINSQFAGIDLITIDPTVPLQESRGSIIEINTTPGLHHHSNLINDDEENHPAVKVLRHLLQITH